MANEINIAEILANKLKGIKLYSPIFDTLVQMARM